MALLCFAFYNSTTNYPMRKKRISYLALSAMTLLSASLNTASAQGLIGYDYNNYLGVNSVTSNPASIASSRYKFHFNLVTVNGNAGNNGYEIIRGNTSFFNFDQWKERRITNGGRKNGWLNADILGPSFLLNLNKKSALAVSSRIRTLTNMYNLSDGAISLFEDPTSDLFGKSFNEKNVKVNAHAFADFGLSYARVLKNEGTHFLKAGATLKYIQGISAASVRLENLDINIRDMNTLNQLSGKGSILYADNIDRWTDDEDDINFKGVSKEGKTVGMDIGAVYEIRDGKFQPDEDRFKSQFRTIPYTFRFSFAITDFAFAPLTYKPGRESANYSLSGSNIKIDTFDVDNADNPEDYLRELEADDLIRKEANVDEFKMFLPTSLRANADWHIAKHFFINADALLSLRGSGTKKSGTNYISTFSVTPRFESQWVSVSSPLSIDVQKQFNWGASLRLGPLFVGSGSLLTSVLKSEFDNLDAYAGLSIPIYQGKRRKKEKKVQAEPVVETPAPQPVIVPAPVVKDTDKDGIIDEKDACPEVAGLAQYNGCPDTDGDTIIDSQDQCPTIAGLAKYNGCPIPDTDGDGVNDEEDRCPQQAGIKANNGCPEIKEEVKKTVERTAKRLFFVFGKATISPNSYPALNELAAILSEDNSLLLDIEGHTDNVGSDTSNLKLSQQRAEAAKQYLIKKGIAADRISAIGFGETQPLAPNTTKEGRAQNRRIVLKIRNN
jgi:outer membrane protein OmpA-like peptidoglycan-associated protein